MTTWDPAYGDVHDFIQKLMSPERAERLDPFVILSFIEVNLHDTVADIGCGPGYFTIPLAKLLVNGKLYALDINDDMLEACRERVAKARMGNVEVMKCQEFEFPLEKESLHGAFLAFVVQQSPDKARFLREVRKLIRHNGWCAVLEWYRKETDGGPPLERRVDPKELESLAQEAGFTVRGWRDLNGMQYLMSLRNR